MNCLKCGEELCDLPFSSEPEELRTDRFCGECNTRFGCSKSGLFIVSEPCETSAIARENMELKITIKTMMRLKEEKVS
tara:strand:+ start:1181 stop:1414 length:234 start_codon:yes stop_codon:yes gene_type:complete